MSKKIFTKAHRRKIGETLRGKPSGMLGKVPWNKGLKGSVKPNKTSFKKGFTPWNKGKKTGLIPKTAFKKGVSGSPKTQFKKGHRLFLGTKRPTITGNKNLNWKGGIDARTRIKNAPRQKPDQCDICGAFGIGFKKGLCLDHNHKTGEFRGWICLRCNFALGMVKDNTETLVALVEYLKRNK